jgi:hypothetical protein
MSYSHSGMTRPPSAQLFDFDWWIEVGGQRFL